MSDERTTSTRSSSPLTLPLWGLFLCSMVIAYQLMELSTNVKNQSDVLLQLQKKHHEVGFMVAGEVGRAALTVSSVNHEVTKELKLLREGQEKPKE